MTRTPDFTVKWGGACSWCGGNLDPGDRGSYDLDDYVCHYECRELMSV
jgi:hypothetical protein